MTKQQSIFRKDKNNNNPFVMINKEMLNDERLSWKAKGILGYLLSMPDDWQVYETEIQRHAADGIASLSSGIKELIDTGYIKRKRKRNNKGHFMGYEYLIYEVSTERRLSKNGLPKNGLSKNGLSKNGKTHTTNNDLTNNDLTNNDLTNNNLKADEPSKELKTKDKNLIIKKWNELEDPIPKIRVLKSGTLRYDNLKARLNDFEVKDVIEAIDNINKSEFLKGKNNRGWTIDFGWFVLPNNFIKVLEGNYTDKKFKQDKDFEEREYDYDELEKKLLGWE